MAQKLTAKQEASLRIDYVPLDEIARFDKNPKKHDVGALVTSIRRYGFRDAPIFDGTLKALVAGHGRLKALEAMKGEGDKPPAGIIEHSAGQWLVPVQMGVDSKSAAEAKAFLIDHNTLTLSGGDLGVDSMLRLYDQAGLEELLKESGPTVSFDGEDIDELINGKREVVEDDPSGLIDAAKELEKKWGTKLGQLWILGEHRVLCGDSTKAEDVGRVMGGARAGLCFTSPPYGQQRDYTAAIGDWDALMRGVFSVVPMTDDGQVLVNLGLIHRDGEWWPYWDGWIAWMREQGWRRFGWYVWDQGPGMPGDWGGRLAPSFEFVWHFNADAVKPLKARECKHAGERHGGKGQRGADGVVKKRSSGTAPVQRTAILDSVIRVNRQGASHGALGHPAPYPVGLPASAIVSWAGIVYDPFLGSGTTLIAADQLNRKCYGLEISPQYVAVILERWSKLTGGEPKLDG